MSGQAPGARAWSDLDGAGAVQRGEFRVIETGVRAGTGSVLYAVDAVGCRHVKEKAARAVAEMIDLRRRGLRHCLHPSKV